MSGDAATLGILGDPETELGQLWSVAAQDADFRTTPG
jgi:hypothetical protein